MGMTKRKRDTVFPGERDEEGRLKTPHTCYGLVANIVYTFRKMWKYGRKIIMLVLLAAVTRSVVRYLWVFLGKFLIEIVQAQLGMMQKDLRPLFMLSGCIAVIEIVCICGNTIIMQMANSEILYIRHRTLNELSAKTLTADYQMLEQPHILDLFQRANRGRRRRGNWHNDAKNPYHGVRYRYIDREFCYDYGIGFQIDSHVIFGHDGKPSFQSLVHSTG